MRVAMYERGMYERGLLGDGEAVVFWPALELDYLTDIDSNPAGKW